MWDDIYKPNSIGSEGGTIIADEEYKESCRITLERCERYDAITCGVYGCMMHTAFCNKSHSQEVFDNMKKDLQEFIDKDTTADEESIFYEEFTSKYLLVNVTSVLTQYRRLFFILKVSPEQRPYEDAF